MTLMQDTQALRSELKELASRVDWSVLIRYELPQKPSPILRKRIRQRVDRVLRILGLSRTRYLLQKWDVGLKHGPSSSEAKPLLIWAEGHDRQFVREACEGMKRLLEGRTDLLPVLVTDVADFAFYSRLGWLVEYLPELSGTGPSYRDRKRCHLAWRYREAVAVPLSAGLASPPELEMLF